MNERLRLIDQVGLLAFMTAVVGVLVWFITFRMDGLTDQWFSLLVVTLLLFVPLVVACVRRRFDPLEPIFIVLAAYFLYFVFSPARDLLEEQHFFFGVFVPPLLPEGSFYLACGLAALLVGYYTRTGTRLAERTAAPTMSRHGAVTYAVVLGIAAVVLFGAWARLSGLTWLRLLSLGQLGVLEGGYPMQEAEGSALNNYLFSTLDWFAPAVMIAIAFSKRFRWLLIPAFLLVLVLYATVGLRYRVLILVLAPVVYFYLRRENRPRITHIALAGVMTVLLIGGIGSIRTKVTYAMAVTPEDLSVAQAREAFMKDLSIYQPYLAIIEDVPSESNFLMGRSFTYLLAHPIPRRLWPDKPEPPVHQIIRSVFGGDDAVQAGVAYPNIGEYYANFGVVGVVAGMWLFGVLLRWLWAWAYRHRSNRWAACFYAIALPLLVQVVSRGHFVQIFQTVLFFLGPIGVGMIIAKRRAAARQRSDLPALGRLTVPTSR